MEKPDWWPENPYFKNVFIMPEEKYLELVPDPRTRTALSGMLGREFWDLASETIWSTIVNNIDKEEIEKWMNY